MSDLREKIVEAIRGSFHDWSDKGEVDPELAADRILAIPEIAEALRPSASKRATD